MRKTHTEKTQGPILSQDDHLALALNSATYAELEELSKKLGVPVNELADEAVSEYLKRKRSSDEPEEFEKRFRELSGAGPKKWWAKQTKASKKARAQRAARARWDKKKKPR